MSGGLFQSELVGLVVTETTIKVFLAAAIQRLLELISLPSGEYYNIYSCLHNKLHNFIIWFFRFGVLRIRFFYLRVQSKRNSCQFRNDPRLVRYNSHVIMKRDNKKLRGNWIVSPQSEVGERSALTQPKSLSLQIYNLFCGEWEATAVKNSVTAILSSHVDLRCVVNCRCVDPCGRWVVIDVVGDSVVFSVIVGIEVCKVVVVCWVMIDAIWEHETKLLKIWIW